MMIDHREIHLKLAKLRAEFIKNAPFDNLSDQFDRQLQRRRAVLTLGLFEEARGIAVVGAAGSGKSTLVHRVLTQHPDILQPRLGEEKAEVVSITVPSPATLKDVGSSILGAVGYDTMRKSSAGAIWDQARTLLRNRGTLFVHLDEAQHLFTSQNRNVQNTVVDTLKTLMNSNDWPVGLILSGTPKMLEMINSDDQLTRRIDMVNLAAISWTSHGKEVRSVFSVYAMKAGLEVCSTLQPDAFLPRLIHAGSNEFGLTVEWVLRAIEVALLTGAKKLQAQHFAEAFHRKSGCVRGLNPFVVSDYLAVDTRAVMGNAQYCRQGATG